MIQESQRLREIFDQNVVQFRTTLEESKNLFAACGWPARPEPAPSTEAASHAILAGLTRREIEVLRLIAEGKSSKEVAAELGIAFRTAVCHRYRIFQKLNVHETASVVRIAIRAGLVNA
ncbi:MAG TPA: LuxR C-terminal-related transcriptional regulator [Bryobacteraceae bacterium]|nr:LuxR C-terminal-related transcriptional regulator [Bryobacteraceae bacterium]